MRGGARAGAGRPAKDTVIYYRRVKPEWVEVLDAELNKLKGGNDMRKLVVTHHPKRKCISFTYDDNHQWNIFDVEEGSCVLDLFGGIQYAIDNGMKLTINTEEE
jgi:hypothetical protein